MSTTDSPSTTLKPWLQRAEVKRGILYGVGLGCLALGVVAALLPMTLITSLVRVVGVLLIGSAIVKAIQLILSHRSARDRRHGWPFILAEVALDAVMGSLLINHRLASADLVVTGFGLLFLSEAVLYFLLGLRSPTTTGRGLLWLLALGMSGMGLAILFHLVADPIGWAGLLVGLKLILFGTILVLVAITMPRSGVSALYQAPVIEPVPAELYSVYFGTAFHLGVFIGNGQVVHYLDDNHVHQASWDEFLKDRIPQHWTYPDLDPVPPDVVIETALSEVGKTYPYNLLKFNCEHFAIYCKSGGKTRYSAYAQVPVGLENAAKHPLAGMIAEWNTRVVEWLAFHLGGESGKRLSLQIRRIGSTVTAWLLSRGSRPASPKPVPDSHAQD